MSAAGPGSDWATETIAFLSDNLPRRSDCEGWDHMFTTAYQVGCMALVALGHAEETVWGAVPSENPALPAVLPRWDDICTAVLWLAEQKHLDYRKRDGSALDQPMGWVRFNCPKLAFKEPNIAATAALGPARASSNVLPVLEALGLVARGAWTVEAETVLWRSQPEAWGMDISSDTRFVAAVQIAVDTVPFDVRRHIEKLVTITDDDFASNVVRGAALRVHAGIRRPSAGVTRPRTVADYRRGVALQRQADLDDIFFCRWRLADGWLQVDEARRALHIFNDSLATRMRRAVVGRLHPEFP